MTTYKITENGNGFSGVKLGTEVYDAATGELIVVASDASIIYADPRSGNYVLAVCKPSDRDVSELTPDEFLSLMHAEAVRS